MRWGGSPDLFYAYDEGLWQIAGYVKSLPPGQDIFITPRPAKDATLAFAWREGPPVRHFDGRSAVIAPPPDRDATYVVIEHEDFRSGKLLAQLYPEAQESKTFYDRQGRVYARVLSVPAGSRRARRPGTPADAAWPGIELIGFDTDKQVYRPSDIVYLQLWWQVTSPITTDWTVFTHVLGPPRAGGSVVWAGKDARPGQGSLPTTDWAPGDTILDEYQIQLPQDMPTGEYEIEAGLYDPARDGERCLTLKPAGQDHVILARLRVQ